MNSQLAREFAEEPRLKATNDALQKKRKKNFFVRFKRGFLRLNRKERLYFLLFIAFCLLIVVGIVWAIVGSFSTREKDPLSALSPLYGYVNPTEIDLQYRYFGSYHRTFDDLNALHLEAAKKYGVNPTQLNFDTEEGRQGMLQVTSDSLIKVDRLTHSMPFLVWDAYCLLHDLSVDFARRLDLMGIPRHRLIVTSLTRTQEQRAKLEKVNANASANSAHCYGTTFDISWSRFDPVEGQEVSDAILKQHLAAIIKQYQEAGRCYVKHERRQACFHITAIGSTTQFRKAES